LSFGLTLILLTWRIGWATNASRWQMGFNLVFKGLKYSGGTQFECFNCVILYYYFILLHYVLYVNLSASVFIHRLYICVFL